MKRDGAKDPGRPQVPPVDPLIREFLSYRLFMKGKEPLGILDVASRTRSKAWRDEGVDIDVLPRYGMHFTPDLSRTGLFQTEKVRVRVNVFFKREHLLLTGLCDPVVAASTLEGDPAALSDEEADRTSILCRSDLLFPMMLSLSGREMGRSVSSMEPGSREQSEPPDISWRRALSQFIKGEPVRAGPEDLSEVLSRKLPQRGDYPSLPKGRRDMLSILDLLLEGDDEQVAGIISSGDLQRVSSEVLKSPSLASLFADLCHSPDGSAEGVWEFRLKLGRSLVQGSSSDMVIERILKPMLKRLRTCDQNESVRIERISTPMVDHRSTQLLLELLFSVDKGKRQTVLRLLGRTGDPSAAQPLRKLMEFSMLLDDREAAKGALAELGFSR